MTTAQIQEASQEIAELIVYPKGEVEARKVMRAKWGWTSKRTNKLIKAIYASWHREDERNRKFTKSQSIRRIEMNMRLAARKGQFAAVAAMETQLAKIQGTEEPLKVKVDAVLGPIVGNVLASMDVGMMAAMAREYDELQALVRAHKALLTQGEMQGEVVLPDTTVSKTESPTDK